MCVILVVSLVLGINLIMFNIGLCSVTHLWIELKELIITLFWSSCTTLGKELILKTIW